jgi:hypothetical protein
MSDSLEVKFSQYPQAPTIPLKVDSLSSLESIYLQWGIENSGDELFVIGYQLWGDSGSDGLFSLILDGRNQPGITSHIVHGLQTGVAYKFKTVALNFNGAGQFSSEVTYFSCLPPQDILPP